MNRAEALRIGTVIANRWWRHNKPNILSQQHIDKQKAWQQIKSDSAGNSWELKINGHDELLVRMERYSSESERLINEALKSKGSDIAADRITEKIPVSEADLRRGHQHAKNSRPLKTQYINLGFIIRPTRKFEYLKYPDLGIGTSKRNQPDEFMRRGLGLALDPITELLIRQFDKLNK